MVYAGLTETRDGVVLFLPAIEGLQVAAWYPALLLSFGNKPPTYTPGRAETVDYKEMEEVCTTVMGNSMWITDITCKPRKEHGVTE